ncbi:flagellar protein FlaG [Bacillus sp. FJAT-47783]|uniref:flagellar protein FlaG n=1 Tax=Bacillus sp. FJAT-47783 TaxID=2922712 RepID=UPI001FAD978F|nr:flagellar protein FlaG [Bacillus sp. FJAT-47783]
MSVEGVFPSSSLRTNDSYVNRSPSFPTVEKNDTDHSNSKDVVNKEELKTVIDNLNEFVKPVETSIQFELHEQLNEYYVKVINKETEEVVREIPPKKMLDMYAAMAELMGFIINEKV